MRRTATILGGCAAAAIGLAIAIAPSTPTLAQDDAALMTALMAECGPLYRGICRACHGAAAEGGVGPALAGDAFLSSASQVANQIINGSTYMPAFGGQLSNREVAAVATYVRNSFGNSFGVVTEAVAAAAR